MTVAVISPHTDDAIFSLGSNIMSMAARGDRVVIITPFAGVPKDEAGKKKHRRLRKEHKAACSLIGAEPVNGNFLDDVYARTKTSVISEWIRTTLAMLQPDRILCPLGIYHPDHIQTLLAVREVLKESQIDYYLEQPYAARNQELTNRLIRAVIPSSYSRYIVMQTDLKREALHAYESQVSHELVSEILGEAETMFLSK